MLAQDVLATITLAGTRHTARCLLRPCLLKSCLLEPCLLENCSPDPTTNSPWRKKTDGRGNQASLHSRSPTKQTSNARNYTCLCIGRDTHDNQNYVILSHAMYLAMHYSYPLQSDRQTGTIVLWSVLHTHAPANKPPLLLIQLGIQIDKLRPPRNAILVGGAGYVCNAVRLADVKQNAIRIWELGQIALLDRCCRSHSLNNLNS